MLEIIDHSAPILPEQPGIALGPGTEMAAIDSRSHDIQEVVVVAAVVVRQSNDPIHARGRSAGETRIHRRGKRKILVP